MIGVCFRTSAKHFNKISETLRTHFNSGTLSRNCRQVGAHKKMYYNVLKEK